MNPQLAALMLVCKCIIEQKNLLPSDFADVRVVQSELKFPSGWNGIRFEFTINADALGKAIKSQAASDALKTLFD